MCACSLDKQHKCIQLVHEHIIFHLFKRTVEMRANDLKGQQVYGASLLVGPQHLTQGTLQFVGDSS